MVYENNNISRLLLFYSSICIRYLRSFYRLAFAVETADGLDVKGVGHGYNSVLKSGYRKEGWASMKERCAFHESPVYLIRCREMTKSLRGSRDTPIKFTPQYLNVPC